MGIRVEILLTDEAVEPKSVRATPYLPGLVLHRAPDCSPGASLMNVTHSRSGLAVLTHVDPGQLAEVKAVLSGVSWTGLPEDFCGSDAHWAAVENAMSIAKRSKSQELRIAHDLEGGRRQPASGSRWGARRDVVTPLFCIEAKTTVSDRYAVQEKDLVYLTRQANTRGRVPAYIVEVAGREEVVLLPYYEVDRETLEALQVRDVACYTKKSFSVTEDLAVAAVDGAAVAVSFASGKWLAFGYANFRKYARVFPSESSSAADD